MAYMNTSSSFAPLMARALNTLGHMTEGAASYMTRRRIYRQTVAELAALSDHELADLGIHRSHIRRIADETARNLA